MDDLNAVQLAWRATQFGYETLVDGVQVTLEQGVVAGWVAGVLMVPVRSELGVMTIAFAHEDVDLAGLQDPIETGQLAKVDFERVWTTFLTLCAGRAITSGRLAAFLARRVLLAQEDVLGLRRQPFLGVDAVVVFTGRGAAAVLLHSRRILLSEMTFYPPGIFLIVLAGPDG